VLRAVASPWLDRGESFGCRHLPLCAELAWRHSEAASELLAEVVLRLEATEMGDLADLELAILEKARSFLEALFFEELTEESSGRAVEAARHILACEPEIVRDLLDGELFVPIEAASYAFQQGADEIIHD